MNELPPNDTPATQVVLFPRNAREQAALSAAFTQTYRDLASDNRDNKFETPKNQLALLKEGPLLNLVRSSSIPDPEKNSGASNTRKGTNDKDRSRGLPYVNFSIWQIQEKGKETLIESGKDVVMGDEVLNHEALKRLKPYLSSTLNQAALNGCLMRYIIAALPFYLPNTSWINVLGGSPYYSPRTELKILCLGENQFQLTFTQLGFKKSENNEEYSDNTFSFTLNLTFGSTKEEMPSEVTLSQVKLTPFSRELRKAIDAEKELQRKLTDMSFIAKKLNDPIYCHLISTLIFIEKINLNKVLRIANPQQKIDLLKSIFGREEFSDWFSQLPESAQDDLLAHARVLPISEKIKFLTLHAKNIKVKEVFAKDIGWNATTDNINDVSAEELRKIVLLDEDSHHAILKKIIDDAQKPIESYNFFERRFPRLFPRKHTINEDIANKKYTLHLLLSIPPLQNNSSEQAFAYITAKDNQKAFAEALLSNLTLPQKLKRYHLANDPLKLKLAEPIKNCEEFSTSSVSDLLRAGATEAELTVFAKFKSDGSPAVNETTEAIIKGALKKTKPLNFFERNFPRIFKHKARKNREIEVQQRTLSALVSSDKSLADEIQGKIHSKNTPWSEKLHLVDILFKPDKRKVVGKNNLSYTEQLKSQAEIFFHQVLPEKEFISNAETYAGLTTILPIGIQDMSVDDIKEGNTTSRIYDFFLGQYTLLCLPLNTLPKQEDFENDATIKKCCEMITKRTQQIKELLETLILVAKLENATPTVKQKTFDSALQDEVQSSALAKLALLLPNDPYGALAYLEGKNTLNISVQKSELPAFVRQKIPVGGEEEIQPEAKLAPIALQRSPSASKIVSATGSPRNGSDTEGLSPETQRRLAEETEAMKREAERLAALAKQIASAASPAAEKSASHTKLRPEKEKGEMDDSAEKSSAVKKLIF